MSDKGGDLMPGEEVVPIATSVAKAAGKALGDDDDVKRHLMELAKESPEMKAAAESYARRIAIKQALVTKLYEPFARWAGVSREYFSGQFAEDMSAKVADTPEEDLTEPPPSVAIPAMQGLSYSLDDEQLKEMYLNLLATATDGRSADQAHPSFADIIKQLSPAEAQMLANILEAELLPIVRLSRRALEGPGGSVIANHVMDVRDDTGEPAIENSLPVWVDNWVRLGLVEVDYARSFTAKGLYDWLEDRPEIESLSAQDERGRDSITDKKGVLLVTEFGKRFAKAVLPKEPAG